MKIKNYEYKGTITSKKNSKQIITNPRTGRPMIISNSRARKNQSDMVAQFMEQMDADRLRFVLSHEKQEIKAKAKKDGEKYAVFIRITEPDKIHRDLDNQATSILDALVEAGALPDDNVQFIVDLRIMLVGFDKDNAGAIIEVKEL